ncbi:TIGR02680 family protein, partial [Halobacillus sp. BBL2006]|uniref:TIGR02680 family protein n=1 Tax=Halobacillus sp. BBL2006 TaxID=1543706 RepID=UPI0005423D63
DDLRHLSDTIEHMDETRQHIDQVERHIEALGKMSEVYGRYNQFRLGHHAAKWQEASRRVEAYKTALEEARTATNRKEEELQNLVEERDHVTRREAVLTDQEERLRSHDVWRLEREKKEEEENLKYEEKNLQGKEEKLTTKQRAERGLRTELDGKEMHEQQQEEAIEDQLTDLENDAAEASFLNHEFNVKDFRRLADVSFETWKKQSNAHIRTLRELEERLEKLEKMKEKRQEKEREYSVLELNRDRRIIEEREWQRTFDEDKQKKIEEIFTWVKEAPWQVEDEVLQETSRRLYSLYEPVQYREVFEPFYKKHEAYTKQLGAEKLKKEHALDLLELDLETAKYELETWKKKRDPEPPRSEGTVEARVAWTGVPVVPLYEAVEFRDGINFDTKNRIEAALFEMGLLDALITEEATKVKHDRVIVPEPKTMAHTLNDYLQADVLDGNVSKAVVEDVLLSIQIGEGGASISEDGSYRLDLLTGHAPHAGEAKFIGRTARERYRKEKIRELEQQIQSLKEQVSDIQQELHDLEKMINISTTALRRFPDDEDLIEIFQDLMNTRRRIEHLTENMKDKDKERKALYREFRSMNHQLEEDTRPYELTRTRETYKKAVLVMDRYRDDLSKLELLHQTFLYIQKDQESLRARIEERQAEIDELQGEINGLVDQVSRRKMTLEAIRDQLKHQEAEEIRREISVVLEEQGRVRKRLSTLMNEIPRMEVAVDKLKSEGDENRRRLKFSCFMEAEWRRLFVWESELDFVDFPKESSEESLARSLAVSFKEDQRESQLLEQVTKKFHEVNQDLVEYQMQQYPGNLYSDSFEEELTNEERLIYKEWEDASGRNFVELNYEGRQVSPMTAEEKQREIQAHQKQMLDEQDRELYEEILFKSVGNKLRSRIRRAEKWTEKMNGLMESRNSSSGLTFSIRWKPRTADHDEELDTKELVELLHRKPQIMKEEDFDRMIEHFRSRIDRAKETMFEKGEGQTLLQVLKEVLDYRKWFSFVLSYKRPDEPKRELTNNAFYKFSGGEKAMAMYIPLFAACYSRYQEASDSAPYIISLDEAFAGVDENNIREMFEIVEELGFDYIMNSQVLWGDYDTVKNLAVSELIRPLNVGFVAVMNYEWNGQSLENREKEVEVDG